MQHHEFLVKYLLFWGHKPNERTTFHCTCVDLAVRTGNRAIESLLRSYGGKSRKEIQWRERERSKRKSPGQLKHGI